MRPLTLRLPFLLLIFPALAGAQAPTATLQAAIEARLAARVHAASAADSAAYHRYIHPDLVSILDDGTRTTAAQQLRYIANRPTGRSRYAIDSVQLRVVNGLAIVDYRNTEYVRYGDREIPGPMRSLDLFERDRSGWVLRAHAEAPLLSLPDPVAVDSATLADYVGDYEWWPGYVDRIRLEGSLLTEQGPDDPASLPLRAATPTSFFFDADPSLLMFERDRAGAVSGYIIHFPTGQVLHATKRP